jgi:nucleotide-binding universal stress UspA family protein
MISIERIFCPVSLPLHSDEALPHAISLARSHNARVIICYCAGEPVVIAPDATAASKVQITKVLEDSLSSCLRTADAGRVRCEVVVGESGKDIGENIVSLAYEQHADMIVMRSRRSSIPALLGSIAEQVSRTALCPVLITRSQVRDWKCELNGKAKFRKLLVSHDFSGASELALSYALSIALKLRADVHLIHVLSPPDEDEPEVAWGPLGIESAFYRVTKRLQSSVPEEVYRECRVQPVVRWGKPYREILAYVREQEIDLICIGSQGRDFGLASLFGSNVDRVLRQASCPVLVARPIKQAVRTSVDKRILAPEWSGTLLK